MEASIPNYPEIQINPDYLKDGALKLIALIQPDWHTKDNLKKLNFKIFTDGITNRLIGVYKDRVEDMILFRVYGEKTDLFIDRTLEYRNMRTMYKAGLSAPIYCTFLNGISYGFTPGKVLDERIVRDEQISILIAENMARMHTLKPKVTKSSNCLKDSYYSEDPQPCIFTGLNKFLSLTEMNGFSVKNSKKLVSNK